MSKSMESWRLIFRTGFAPLYSEVELERLLVALRTDDIRLIQGSTTTPPPLMCVADWLVEGADAVGFPGIIWGESTVGESEEYFARKCFECDQRLGEPAACRWFLNWFDDTPRNEMRRELSVEVERALEGESDYLQLDPALESALDQNPTDWILRGAVADWYRERNCDKLARHYDRLALKLRGQNATN